MSEAIYGEISKADFSYFNHNGIEKADAGDYEGAIKDFNKAIEISPFYSTIYFNRATVKVRLGDIDGAKRDFEKAMSLSLMQ